MPQPPPFARSRRWRWRASHIKRLNRRVWYDPDTGYEYLPDPTALRGTWHEMNPRTGEYRDLDPFTGRPVAGHEGRWRPLQ